MGCGFVDMSKYSNENDGIAFVLIVIDIFSKFLWMQPLKDKKGESVTAAFKNIFEKAVILPEFAQIKVKSSDPDHLMLY